MRIRSYLFAGSLALSSLLAAPARESAACGNEVEHRTDFRIQIVSNADRSTAEGKHRAALEGLRTVPLTGELAKSDAVVKRAYLVAALAVARTDGRYNLSGVEVTGEKGSAEAMAEAASIAKHFYTAGKDDSTVKTNYAEIMSRVPEHAGEAKRILTELEAKDLITSAYGYAALARMREAAGQGAAPLLAPALVAMEHAPAMLAKARCERMASFKGICSGESAERMNAPGTFPSPKAAGASRGLPSLDARL